jgi:hypothetical protein
VATVAPCGTTRFPDTRVQVFGTTATEAVVADEMYAPPRLAFQSTARRTGREVSEVPLFLTYTHPDTSTVDPGVAGLSVSPT